MLENIIIGMIFGFALWVIFVGEASASHERYVRKRQADARKRREPNPPNEVSPL